MTSVRPVPHVVLYVGGASERSAVAVETVNRFCDALPGGFRIRVINVGSQTDIAALDGRPPAPRLIGSELPQPARLTRRQRAERAARRTDRTEAAAEAVRP